MPSFRVCLAFAVVITFLSLLAPTHASSQEAARLRRQGEEAMLKRDYKQSIGYFTKLIDLENTPKNHYKRATVAFRQQDYPAVVKDMDVALAAPSLSKPDSDSFLLLRVQAQLNMGLCTEAQKDTSKLPPTAQAQTHKARADACVNAERHLSNLARQYRLDLSAPQFTLLSRLPAHARSQLSSAIDELLKHSAPANELVYARSLLYLLAGDAGQVITLTGTLSKDNTARTGVVSTPSKKDFSQLSLLVRATAYFLMGESAAALGYTKKALRDDPESKPFKTLFKTLKKSSRAIEQAETAAAQNEWARALKVHGEALAEHPGRTNTILGQLDVLGVGAKTSTVTLPASESLSRLHAKHCNMHVRAAQADEKHAGAGVSACEAGLQAWRLLRHGDNGDLDMLLDKAECQLIADKAQDAINTYQSILQRDQQNARARNGMQKAQARLKQANSKDYYKMLGVSRQANKKTLKKAFHKLAKQYHPDMVSEEEKEEAQRKFQEISEAYEVLADDEKRSKFDRGEDVFGNNPQPQGHPFRHHHPFANAGFGGGGFSFRFG